MRPSRLGKHGFTLVETLVVVVIIGILTTIALPNFLGAQRNAKLASVRANMHAAQLCAEHYSTDSGGVYPPTAADLDPYWPQGGNQIGGAAGKRPMNPYTQVLNQPLYGETLTTTALILSTRNAPPTAGPGTQGAIGYCEADAGRTYCVSGTDEGTNRVAGPAGTTLILSNM
jgi:prepilin-type N-terminal cleavage/methylation domain-containing protein